MKRICEQRGLCGSCLVNPKSQFNLSRSVVGGFAFFVTSTGQYPCGSIDLNTSHLYFSHEVYDGKEEFFSL